MNLFLISVSVVIYLCYNYFIASYINQKKIFNFFLALNIVFLIVIESLFYHILGKGHEIFRNYYVRVLVIISLGLAGAFLSKSYRLKNFFKF